METRRTRNFSKDSNYHTQRNNAQIPFSSCNTTSMVMALKQAGWNIPAPAGVQPEDHLTTFLRGDCGMGALARLAPWAIDRVTKTALYPPNEVHAVLSWGVNELLQEEVSVFRTDWLVDELPAALTDGCGIVLSGTFPLPDGGELGHVVSLAGYITAEESHGEDTPSFSNLDMLLLDDPYGDWRTGYHDHRGNDTPMAPTDFMQIMKPAGSRRKWAHRIVPAPRRS